MPETTQPAAVAQPLKLCEVLSYEPTTTESTTEPSSKDEDDSRSSPHYISEAKTQYTLVLPLTKDADGSEVCLGLDVSEEERSLRIASLMPGLISEWNDAGKEPQVKTGDFIIAINGVSGGAEQLL